MTPEQFVYWLNGFAELNPSLEQPTPEQWKSITEHLKTVFVKVTPEVKVQINPGPGVPSGEQLAEAIRKFAKHEIDKNQMIFSPSKYEKHLQEFPLDWGTTQITC